jgi:hypothetical protein
MTSRTKVTTSTAARVLLSLKNSMSMWTTFLATPENLAAHA